MELHALDEEALRADSRGFQASIDGKRSVASASASTPVTPAMRTKRLRFTKKSSSESMKTETYTPDSFGVAELGLAAKEEGDEEGEDMMDEEAGGDKICPGCQRSLLTGRCWICPSDPVPWALPDGRGRWCRECHTTWRLVFKFPLALLDSQFSNPAVQAKFNLGILAVVSLRRDGEKRVSDSMLQSRMATFKWLLNELGIPAVMPFKVVVPLADMADSGPTSGVSGPAKASTLVTVEEGGRSRLGYIVQRDPAAEEAKGGGVLRRPLVESSLNLPSLRVLHSVEAKDADADCLSQVFGLKQAKEEMSVLENAGGAESENVEIVDLSAVPKSKSCRRLLARARAAVQACEVVLSSFTQAQNQWEEKKERDFTAPMSKVADARVEAVHNSCEDVAVQLSALEDVMAKAKMLVGKYKRAMRLKSPMAQNKIFGDMSEAVEKVHEALLRWLGDVVCVDFLVLRLTCCFWREGNSFSRKIEELQRKDMDKVLLLDAKQKAKGSNYPCAWLTSNVVSWLAEEVSQTSAENSQKKKEELVGELEAAEKLLGAGSLDVAQLLEDLRMFKVLCMVGSGDSGCNKVRLTFDLVCKAEEAMKVQRLLPLYNALTKSPCGQELLRPVSEMKVVSASDALANQSFEAAKMHAEKGPEARLAGPSADGQGERLQVVHAGSLLGSASIAAAALSDACKMAVEAIGLWSESHFKDEAIKHFTDRCMSFIVAGEIAQLVQVYQVTKETVQALEESKAMGVGCEDLLLCSVGLVKAHAALAECGKGTAAMVVAVERLLSAIKGKEGKEELTQEISESLKACASNVRTREMLMDIIGAFAAMVNVGGGHLEGPQMVQQWQEKGDASLLQRAVVAIHKAEALQQRPPLNFFKAGVLEPAAVKEVVLCVDKEEDPDDMGAMGELSRPSLQELLCLPMTFGHLPLVHLAVELVGRALQHLPDSVCALGQLQALVLPSHKEYQRTEGEDADAPCSFQDVVSKFVQLQKFTMTPSFSAMLEQKQEGHVVLLSAKASQMLRRLVACSGTTQAYLAGEHIMRGEDSGILASNAAICELCDVYVDLHHVASGMVWLVGLGTSGSELASDGRVRRDVEEAFNVISMYLDAATEKLHSEKLLELRNVGLRLTPAQCAEWVEAARQSYKALGGVLVHSLVKSMSLISQSVMKTTPAVSHFAEDDNFSAKLIKQRIMVLPHKEALTSMAARLFQAIREVSRVRAWLGVGGALSTSFEEQIAVATKAFRDAKHVVTLCSVARVVYGMQGAQRAKEASAWVVKGQGGLPKPLWAELQAAAKGGMAPKAADE